LYQLNLFCDVSFLFFSNVAVEFVPVCCVRCDVVRCWVSDSSCMQFVLFSDLSSEFWAAPWLSGGSGFLLECLDGLLECLL
jgi:hypothetical protein